MYKIIDEIGHVYTQYTYTKEADFERMIVANAATIFGEAGIYFDIKKLIGTPKKGAAIPDGYFLDLTFHNDPRLYLVEVELNSHDVYGHIGEQILRFGISTETDKYKLKNTLLTAVNSDASKKKKLAAFFAKSKHDNLNELLDRDALVGVVEEIAGVLSTEFHDVRTLAGGGAHELGLSVTVTTVVNHGQIPLVLRSVELVDVLLQGLGVGAGAGAPQHQFSGASGGFVHRLLLAAGHQAHQHNQGQDHCQNFFHYAIPSF